MPIGSPHRLKLVRTVLVTLASVAILWASILLMVGGFDTTFAGIRIRSNNPTRLMTVAAALMLAFVALGGRMRVPVRPIAVAIQRVAAFIARRPAEVVGILAVLVAAAGVVYGARTAGGSDAYGYVSQAHLWLHGQLKVPQPWATEVPWVENIKSFAPLGYRAAPEGEWAIVPVYSPGVPMMLAAAKLIVGDWGLYLVIPVFGAVSVVATYRLGRRLASPWVSVGAAWLIATTPPAVAVLMEPLTDVPAMAMWTLSVTALLGRGRSAMARAGLLASVAILIRPNLVILVAPLALWPLARRDDGPGSRALVSRVIDAAVFGACASLGAIFIAWLASYLYGSPFESGYGPASYLYSWSRILPNLPRYFGWYVEAHTPVAVLGMVAMLIPLRQIWPDAPDRRIFPILVLFNIALWLLYASYFEYDSWGFLRFLLPGWPVLMLGTVATLAAIARSSIRHGRVATSIVSVAVIALGVWQTDFTRRQGMFNQRDAARLEIAIGPLVKAHTQPNSVVMTIQRSGSLRYYAGRVTLRYDLMAPATLDRDLAWLASRGVFAYALLDTHEVAEFRTKFASQKAVSALDTPTLVFKPGGLTLFDLTPGALHGDPIEIASIPADRFEVIPPEPLPSIVLKH